MIVNELSICFKIWRIKITNYIEGLGDDTEIRKKKSDDFQVEFILINFFLFV
jgi:hypothetical protein